MINTVWGSTDKPVSSTRLAELLSEEPDLEGTLYIGYPIIGTPEGSFPIDALLVSPTKGLVLFSVVEGRTLPDYAEAQDEGFNKMQAKLLQHQTLIRKRKLLVGIHTVTFAPAIAKLDADEEYLLCNADNLVSAIEELEDFDPAVFPSLVSVIQAISTLRRGRKKRDLRDQNSRGTKIKTLEDSIANLDSQQSAAVVETYEGVQRIRGLAGCGKTIVLALKVAYLHARHPDWFIAVTFNTRSLKKQFENLITTFVLEQANEEPDWDKIRILNAWGAPGGSNRTGIYYEFCRDHGVEYLDFGTAKNRFGSDKAFEEACDIALQGAKQFVPKYDAVLVDEAQDFAPNFLLLCYEYLKDPKRLVYAYDELQNLGNRSLPPLKKSLGRTQMEQPVSLFTPLSQENPSKTSFSTLAIATPVLSCPRLMPLGLGFIAPKALFKSLRTRTSGSTSVIKRTMGKSRTAKSSRSLAHQNPARNSWRSTRQWKT
jgi:superfamily I DNA and RNA helicase